jgi:hypothetical protein
LFRRVGDEHSQRWLCSYYINAIFQPRPQRSDLEPVIREFSRSPSRGRRLAQRAYVGLATHRFGALLAAQAYLEVSPPISRATHWLIVGGNHKLRILDRPAGTAVALLKDGFDDRRMRTEISIRRRAEQVGLPVPPMLRVAADDSWFEESYITGTPLNRLKDRHRASRAVRKVGKALALFSIGGREEHTVDDYVRPLLDECRKHLDDSALVEDAARDRVARCLGLLERRLAQHGQRRMSTGPAHGDFQPGNVLDDGDDRAWLIDWEFAGRRQLGHDGLTYALALRHPTGLAERLSRFVRRPLYDDLLREWSGPAWGSTEERCLSALLLVLEELRLALEESNNPRLLVANPSMGTLIEEAGRWLETFEAPS